MIGRVKRVNDRDWRVLDRLLTGLFLVLVWIEVLDPITVLVAVV